MPTLKQLNCRLEWGAGASLSPLTEYATSYADGFVQSYVVTPSVAAATFSIHLTSKGYIAPGLAMFAFVDGVYQCNRNRFGLRMPAQARTKSDTEVNIRLRQKEERLGDGSWAGKEWRFEDLSIAEQVFEAAPEGPSNTKGSDLSNWPEHAGKIEVVVLRCQENKQILEKVTANLTAQSEAVTTGDTARNRSAIGTTFDGGSDNAERALSNRRYCFDGSWGTDKTPAPQKETKHWGISSSGLNNGLSRVLRNSQTSVQSKSSHDSLMDRSFDETSSEARGRHRRRSRRSKAARRSRSTSRKGAWNLAKTLETPSEDSWIEVKRPTHPDVKASVASNPGAPSVTIKVGSWSAVSSPDVKGTRQPFRLPSPTGTTQRCPSQAGSSSQLSTEWDGKNYDGGDSDARGRPANSSARRSNAKDSSSQRQSCTCNDGQSAKSGSSHRRSNQNDWGREESNANSKVQWQNDSQNHDASADNDWSGGGPSNESGNADASQSWGNDDWGGTGEETGQSSWNDNTETAAEGGTQDWGNKSWDNDRQSTDNNHQGWANSGWENDGQSRTNNTPNEGSSGWNDGKQTENPSSQDWGDSGWGNGQDNSDWATGPKTDSNSDERQSNEQKQESTWKSDPTDNNWQSQDQETSWGTPQNSADDDQKRSQTDGDAQGWNQLNEETSANSTTNVRRGSVSSGKTFRPSTLPSCGPSATTQPYWSKWEENDRAQNVNTKGGRKRSDGVYLTPGDSKQSLSTTSVVKGSVSHQVHPGRAAGYSHRLHRPDYMDTMQEPYAVFVFKYQSKEELEKQLQISIEHDPEEELVRLQSLPKDQIIEEYMNSKSSQTASDVQDDSSRSAKGDGNARKGSQRARSATRSSRKGSNAHGWNETSKPASIKNGADSSRWGGNQQDSSGWGGNQQDESQKSKTDASGDWSGNNDDGGGQPKQADSNNNDSWGSWEGNHDSEGGQEKRTEPNNNGSWGSWGGGDDTMASGESSNKDWAQGSSGTSW